MESRCEAQHACIRTCYQSSSCQCSLRAGKHQKGRRTQQCGKHLKERRNAANTAGRRREGTCASAAAHACFKSMRQPDQRACASAQMLRVEHQAPPLHGVAFTSCECSIMSALYYDSVTLTFTLRCCGRLCYSITSCLRCVIAALQCYVQLWHAQVLCVEHAPLPGMACGDDGDSLTAGSFNEAESHAGFLDALNEWRAATAAARGVAPPPPAVAPARACAPAATPAPAPAAATECQTAAPEVQRRATTPSDGAKRSYFDKLAMNAASRSAAISATGGESQPGSQA